MMQNRQQTASEIQKLPQAGAAFGVAPVYALYHCEAKQFSAFLPKEHALSRRDDDMLSGAWPHSHCKCRIPAFRLWPSVMFHIHHPRVGDREQASHSMQDTNKSKFSFDLDPSLLPGAARTDDAIAAAEIDTPKEGEGGELPSNVIPFSAAKGGKAGSDAAAFTAFTPFATTNAEFLAAIFSELPDEARPIVTAKAGDPQMGGWPPHEASQVDLVCRSDLNTYFNCASIYPGEGGELAAKLDHAAAYHAVVLDDVNTKVARALLGDIKPTWELETSPGNFQIGFKLSPAISDGAEVKRLQQKLAAAGLTDTGALGMVRWARLPQGINGKPKYQRDGKPFSCQLQGWNPDVIYSANTLLAALGLDRIAASQARPSTVSAKQRVQPHTGLSREVYFPPAEEHPVVSAFKDAGLYKREINPGKHDVTCPWVEEHTDAQDTGAAYFEPDDAYPTGGFVCQHSHKDQYHIGEILTHFGLSPYQARNRPLIRAMAGTQHVQVLAVEHILSQQAEIYQSGGMIVRVAYNDLTRDHGIRAVGEAELVMLLGKACDWERLGQSEKWVRCDAPPKVITTFLKKEGYADLPALHGLVRQPCYRVDDGTLLTQPGYDSVSKRLALFDASAFPMIGQTRSDAEAALALLRELIGEFRFDKPEDESAALSGMLTAVSRPALRVAPAYHVKAPASGTGKSYLCDVLSAFAGKGEPYRVSYPTSSEEATKAIMATLLAAPATLQFDDMNTDLLPFPSINRMLTAPAITDRILGVSRMATVSTNTFVLSSGNNVGPIRDMCRRVVTINLNARTAMPGNIVYRGNPMATLKANRERYVMAALTIIEAWKQAGCYRATVPPIASYNDDWADHARHPLMWLGMPDPAHSLIEQMRADPDAENLEVLLRVWHAKHGDKAVTLRRLLEHDNADNALVEAIQDLPVLDGGRINNSKLGWYFKRNADRIVGGFTLQKAPNSQRNAWRVVKVAMEEEPPLPPLAQSSAVTELF